jgi:hypothetical protein
MGKEILNFFSEQGFYFVDRILDLKLNYFDNKVAQSFSKEL